MSNIQNQAKIEVARQRSNVYGFLSALYRQEVDSDFLQHLKDPQFLGVLSDMGVKIPESFIRQPEDEIIEAMAVEFTRLFLGPGKHVSPHESVHHQKDNATWGQLWGDSTVDVKKFIESAGLDYMPDYKGLPDHISVELEFMQQVAERKKRAWEEDDSDGAEYCLKIETKFLEEHLRKWVPVFCEKVMELATLPFYREMASLTKKFIEFDSEELREAEAVTI